MTASERELLRQIRNLQRRMADRERRHRAQQATAKIEIGRLEKENMHLRALVKAHSTMHQEAVENGRYWHGVALANGSGE